uniref:glycoside hydrolase family protein n=1 Tax=uncultured Draconibacterium sp. TaxID=1573823 RepID=UPI003216E15A
MKLKSYILFLSALLFMLSNQINAQITERERPREWDNLVQSGRFMDRFLPMHVQGNLTNDVWGVDAVVPRYPGNGLEDNEWSYWGGNAKLGSDGKYHLFVCRWPESAEKGHMEWPKSIVVHAVSNNSFGPYEVIQTLGPGHNPEIFQLKNGNYVVYVYGGYYIADNLNGPWERKQFDFNPRDRKINDGLSNLTFARREDGSYLMVCRGGGVWISETGTSEYNQISCKSAYPPVEGRFEDPVVWRTNVQYHMIVNDWFGRIAYYLRSKDGVKWKVEPGEAYMPGIAKYEDGTFVDWFKFERIKMLQDEYGRAAQAHFAVIDTIKWNDLGNDKHSSKHICIPLVKGRLMQVLNDKKITSETKTIRVKIEAEEDFNPHTDINIQSLRFGASEEVNFGRGSKVVETEKDGKDLIVIFDGKGNGLTENNFAGKMLGKTADGQLLFGYARLPEVNYIEPILSATEPLITNNSGRVSFEVQNFGQVASEKTPVVVELKNENQLLTFGGDVSGLKPYEKIKVTIDSKNGTIPEAAYDVRIVVKDAKETVLFETDSKTKEE